MIADPIEVHAMRCGQLMLLLAALAAAGSPAQAQRPAPVGGAFRTVHLITVTPAQEPALLAAVADFNHGFAQQGCSSCAYHVFKMFTGSSDQFNFMLSSDWPSPTEYARLHGSPAYRAESDRNPIMSSLSRTEFYGRFVELRAGGSGQVATVWPARPPARSRLRA